MNEKHKLIAIMSKPLNEQELKFEIEDITPDWFNVIYFNNNNNEHDFLYNYNYIENQTPSNLTTICFTTKMSDNFIYDDGLDLCKISLIMYIRYQKHLMLVDAKKNKPFIENKIEKFLLITIFGLLSYTIIKTILS